VVSLEFKCFACSVVSALFVCQKVGVRLQLRNDGAVGQDFFLNVVYLLGQAEVHNFVNLLLNAACVFNQVVFWALALFSSRGVAAFFDKALTLTPVKYLICVASFATKACFVAVNDFLVSEGDCFASVFAEVVFDS